MKILHIAPAYIPAYRHGGPVKSVHYLNKWLVRNGAEVTVYTTNINGNTYLDVPLNQEVNIDGVRVFYFPATFRRWEYSRDMRKALAQNIKNFDLIHITSVFLAASTVGAYYAKKFNKPYIISPRGSLMKEPLKKKSSLIKRIYIDLLEKRNLADAAAIHFTVEAEKQEYVDAKLPLKKSIIIPNGLDFEEFESIEVPLGFFREKFNIGNDKKIILFLGRLNWKKGFDTLIPAFGEIVKKDSLAVLVIAGNDEENYKKEINKLIEINKIDRNKIIFTDMLIGKDKIGAFQDSNVFVLPSYSENFGMAVIESMYFKLPVVITKGVGIALIIEKEKAGIVVEKEKEQLIDAIVKILNDKELARQIGEAGNKSVKKEFSLDKISKDFLKEYELLLK